MALVRSKPRPEVDPEDLVDLTRFSMDFVELAKEGRVQEATLACQRIVRLARRITRDWTLTDEEAVRVAGERAWRSLRDLVR